MKKYRIPFLVIFLLIGYSFHIFSQTSSIEKKSFYHFKTDGGISQNSITSIAQDSIGQIWFTTKDGLIRYNGREYFIYKNRSDNPNSIGHNFVNTVYVSQNGSIWVGCNKGLYKYQPETDNLIQIGETQIATIPISNIIQDQNQLLWFINPENSTLYSYDINHDKFELFPFKDSDSKNVKFYNLTITKDNKIWITTNKTFLVIFNPSDTSFKKIKLFEDTIAKQFPNYRSYAHAIDIGHNSNIIIGTHFGYLLKINYLSKKIQKQTFKKKFGNTKSPIVMFVFEDNEKNIWIGTWIDGLYKIPSNQKKIFHYLPDSNDKTSLSNNIITSVLQDKAGYLWFGSEFSGVNILKKNKKFTVISNNPKNKNSLPKHPYLSVAVDTTNRTWIGTDGSNLCYFDQNANTIYKAEKSILKDVIRIFKIINGRNGYLWIGTGKGLYKYHPKQKTLVHYPYKKDDFNSISGRNVISICEDHDGNIWTGTIYGGLTKIDLKTGKFYRFVPDEDNPKSLSYKYVSSILCDSNNNMWVGTLDGLNKFNPQTGDFTIFRSSRNNSNSLTNSVINCLFEKDDKLWIGTEGGGLNYYSFKDKKFNAFLKKDGLISNNVRGINCDDTNNLWVSTTHNISKFDINSKQFVNYGKSDGLQNSMNIESYGSQELEFFEGFSYRDLKGFLYFGGYSGMVIFHPDSLPKNTYKPPVIIDEFLINGKQILPNKTNTINLTADQNNIEISLTALNFIQPDKNSYAHYLENYDSEWIYDGSSNHFEYYNLPKGKYKFYYKGANNDGVWNDTLQPISITILPAFYQTIAFYLLLLGFVVVLFFAFVYYKIYVKRQLEIQKKLLRYTSSNLSVRRAKAINKKLLAHLAQDDIYLESDLSLHKLAEEIKVKPHDLSQVINQYHKKHFHDFINTYRIRTAKKLLKETTLKIEAVAYDSGFNSISTFNVAFKKETGVTPSQYRKQHS